MSRNSWVAMPLWAGVLACSAAEQKLQLASSVDVEISNPNEVVTPASLRAAVVWVYPGGYFVNEDVAVGEVGATPIRLTLRLELPSEVVTAFADPQEDLEIALFGTRVRVYRPRVLVYSDDGDGLFSPTVLGAGGADKIVAIDESSPSVAAILDLEAALESMSLEETDLYYRVTGGLFTPFVPASEGNNLALFEASEPQPINLRLTDSDEPETRLACGRSNVSVFGNGLFATLRATALVNPPLTLAEACGGSIARCEQRDFNAFQPSLPFPEPGPDPIPDIVPDTALVETPRKFRVAQCRRNVAGPANPSRRLEVLVVHTAILECQRCSCAMEAEGIVYMIDATVDPKPGWWPCGEGETDVKFCDSTLPLFTIDPECVTEEANL